MTKYLHKPCLVCRRPNIYLLAIMKNSTISLTFTINQEINSLTKGCSTWLVNSYKHYQNLGKIVKEHPSLILYLYYCYSDFLTFAKLNEWKLGYGLLDWNNTNIQNANRDWVNNWLNDCVTECLNYWVTDWMSEWETEWMSKWATEQLSEWVNERLSDWVTE